MEKMNIEIPNPCIKGKSEKKYIPIPEDEENPKFGKEIDRLVDELEHKQKELPLSDEKIFEMEMSLVKKFPRIKIEDGKKADNPEFTKILNGIVDRVEQEDGVGLENFKSLKRFSELYSPFLNKLNKTLGSDNEGSYSPILNKIDVASDVLLSFNFPSNIISDLAKRGSTDSIRTIHHEVIHSKQGRLFSADATSLYGASLAINFLAPEYKIISWGALIAYLLYKGYNLNVREGSKILKETHAYRGEARSSSRSQGLSEIIWSIQKSAEKYVDSDMLIAADQGLKKLYALGLNDDEVGDITKYAKWNKKEAVFDNLETKIKQLMDERGLNEEDVDDLVLIDELKRRLLFFKIQKIAQEELIKACG